MYLKEIMRKENVKVLQIDGMLCLTLMLRSDKMALLALKAPHLIYFLRF